MAPAVFFGVKSMGDMTLDAQAIELIGLAKLAAERPTDMPDDQIGRLGVLLSRAPAFAQCYLEARAALARLMEQPTENPLRMTPEQRKELWAAHDQARAALHPQPDTTGAK